jgi:hypothetical protein
LENEEGGEDNSSLAREDDGEEEAEVITNARKLDVDDYDDLFDFATRKAPG